MAVGLVVFLSQFANGLGDATIACPELNPTSVHTVDLVGGDGLLVEVRGFDFDCGDLREYGDYHVAIGRGGGTHILIGFEDPSHCDAVADEGVLRGRASPTTIAVASEVGLGEAAIGDDRVVAVIHERLEWWRALVALVFAGLSAAGWIYGGRAQPPASV